MNEVEHRKAYANAELFRRFNSLMLSGTISAIDTETGLVSVYVSNASGNLTVKSLPLMNRKVAWVAVNDPIVLIAPQGEVAGGMVFVLGPDKQIANLQSQITQLAQQIEDLS